MTETTRDYFEALAPDWDSRMPPDLDAALRRMLTPFAGVLRGAETILEIGTGTGALIPRLREAAPGARLVSVDLAHAMLRNARQRDAEVGLAEADAQQLPLAAGRFDVVVCHNSFPHFADRPRALAEILRVLRPGGTLLIVHNNPRTRVNAIHSQAGGAIAHDLLPPGEELRAMLIAAGYAGVWVDDTDEHYLARGQRPGQGDEAE